MKKILHKLLFPGTAVVAIVVPIGAGLLIYTFLIADDNSPVAYISYVISAYALTVFCAYLIPILKKGNQWFYKNPYVRRYIKDISFKLRISLYCSLVVNLLYSCVNAFSGIYFSSPWFGSLAAYYILLSIMRFSLVGYANKHVFGKNNLAELQRYLLCGVILVIMNLALAGVVILVIHQNNGFEYAGFLIYVMAIYTFYITIAAVVNIIRYRKYNSPVMSAARAVNLAAALVSMLALETAMLTQFGNDDTPAYFRQIITAVTGGAVCFIIIGMGIYMIVHAAKLLRNNN